MLAGGSGFSNGHPRPRRARGPSRDSRGAGHRLLTSSSGTSFSPQHSHERLTPPECTDFDRAYFDSYAHVGIHEEMIKDHVRTETYRAAIMRHRDSIAGKVVMDVGSGTGILSIFCAFAGARRVYAVEASEIAAQAKEVVRANNLSEKIIVLHGRVEATFINLWSDMEQYCKQKVHQMIDWTPAIEDIKIDEKVDVIVSEWMGYMLLYECMLASVIFARDKWLKPGGLILPSHATLYMAPVTHSDRYRESIDFWRDVYGIDMSAMLPLAKQSAFEEPSVETITGENVLTWPYEVKFLDCYTVEAQELESITTDYRFSSMMRAPLHGFAFWFDVEFNGPPIFASTNGLQFLPGGSYTDSYANGSSNRTKRAKSDETIVLSTAPEDDPTHWQQTLLYFYDPIEVQQDQIIEGSITLSQSKENARFLNIHLEYSSGGRSFVKESVMR